MIEDKKGKWNTHIILNQQRRKHGLSQGGLVYDKNCTKHV